MSLEVEALLRAYYENHQALERKGGPTEDTDLFEEVIGLEEEILEKYGLPASNKNKSILWKLTDKKKLTEKHLAQAIEHLQAAAARHLFAPVVSDLEQLQHAKATNKGFFDILPELGHPTHDYCIFLYEEILGFASAEDVLAELSALKRLNCYGELYTLKETHPRSFRRTKVYKQHKPYLKFLDCYLDPTNFDNFIRAQEEEEESDYTTQMPRYEDSVVNFQGRLTSEQPDLFSLARPEEIDFKPEYVTLTDLIVIEEIIFSEDSAVTVSGHTAHPHHRKKISLGFDFDLLTMVIQDYGHHGELILCYFNKNRQLNLVESPAVISLKDKTGCNLELVKHYFKAYKPLTLGSSGKPEVMKEAFYIVEEVVNKERYDLQMVDMMRGSLNGTFHHIKNHYYFYLNARLSGKSEAEARKQHNLEDEVRFEISKYLFLLEKHGGRAVMK